MDDYGRGRGNGRNLNDRPRSGYQDERESRGDYRQRPGGYDRERGDRRGGGGGEYSRSSSRDSHHSYGHRHNSPYGEGSSSGGGGGGYNRPYQQGPRGGGGGSSYGGRGSRRPRDDSRDDNRGDQKRQRYEGESNSGFVPRVAKPRIEIDKTAPRPNRYEIFTSRKENEDKRGDGGQEIQLTTNYFKLKRYQNWAIIQYRVDFNPECELPAKRKYLMYTQRELLRGYLYDTNNSVYLTQHLENDPTVVRTMDREGNEIEVTFRNANVIPMDTKISLQICNLILRRCMEGLNLQLVGRNLFDALAKFSVPDAPIQLWPGYVTSIRQHEHDLLLCAEITHKVMRNETIYDIIRQLTGSSNFNREFENEVIGLTVLTDYNNKTYRIDDVDFTKSPASTFKKKDGSEMSFIDYYRQRYNLNIRDPKQPMLCSRSNDREARQKRKERSAKGEEGANDEDLILLIPELCRPTGLSEGQRSNTHLMRKLSNFTRLNPVTRKTALRKFSTRLSETAASSSILKQWHLTLDTELVKVPGRVMDHEKISYGNNHKEPTSQKFDWQFKDKTMYRTIPLQNWIIIYPSIMRNSVNNFMRTLFTVCRGMDFLVTDPLHKPINDDRSTSYVRMVQESLHCDPQLIMCVVPNNAADRYASIKTMCCVTRGVASQIVVKRTMEAKGLMSIATKIAIQMNCKLGGVPWLLSIPTQGLMVVGIDLSRDTRDPSVTWVALVATMDLHQHQIKNTTFFSTVHKLKNCSEFMSQLQLSMEKALRCYQEQHGTLPEKICLYRDGVGDGQLQYVFENELATLRSHLENRYRHCNMQLKMNFVVVSKKINTRIFAGDINPKPGTVVDDVITLPERFDFYLVSQHTNQGTVSPTSYNVLENNMGLKPKHLQQLTYKLTHLYFNWSGTVRVPAVCQYAHKLSFLVGQFLHEAPDMSLEKQLFFL